MATLKAHMSFTKVSLAAIFIILMRIVKKKKKVVRHHVDLIVKVFEENSEITRRV